MLRIGTGATDHQSFVEALQRAKSVIDQATRIGHHMQYLDIGGGFQDSNFESMAPTIREAVELHIPSDIQIIAEPGRYYARSAYTLVCKVISRRRQIGAEATAPGMLYQNDGVYGNFMNVVIEKEEMSPSLVTPALNNPPAATREEGEHWYTIWGPTCDSVDCVVNKARLDSEVKVGDWLMYKNMGGESPNQPMLLYQMEVES